jgi:hypothetical protein
MSKRFKHSECLEVQGNNGGSYIRLTQANQDGFCHLEVGETCVRTIDCVVSVSALAAILTLCNDTGFDPLLEQYARRGGGSPEFKASVDPITGPWRGQA